MSLLCPAPLIAAYAAAASIAPNPRAASKIISPPIRADFPEDFDIANTAELLFEVCQKREDWQIRIVSENLFECLSGFSLWFIHRSLRYRCGSAAIEGR